MTRRVDFRKLRQQRAHGGWDRHEPQRGLSYNAKRSFRSNKNPKQIVAWLFGARVAKIHYLAAGQHHARTQHMICRGAILQAVNPPCVLSNIASDSAGGLT